MTDTRDTMKAAAVFKTKDILYASGSHSLRPLLKDHLELKCFQNHQIGGRVGQHGKYPSLYGVRLKVAELSRIV
jgi:hypothetical protein